MIYIDSEFTNAGFNLAAEEYIMRFFTEEKINKTVLMFWKTEKCVLIGKNQIAADEIDLQLANLSSVRVIRRSSGGGTIFSDSGNLMQTLITPFNEQDDPKKIEREQYAGLILNALQKMGIPAIFEGRNDIIVRVNETVRKKISGIAQYAVKNRLCTHGTMLYNADLELLGQILKTDPDKIKSKALKSVRARVGNLEEYFTPEISENKFFEIYKSYLFESVKTELEEYKFTQQDIEYINKIKDEKYSNPEWTIGASPKFSFRNSKRFKPGKIEIFMEIESGIIKSCKIFGDFLGILSIDGLEKKLENQLHDFNVISKILENIDLSIYIGEIKPEEFLECLF